MATHFRSSEGQDGMDQLNPEAMPYEQQPAAQAYAPAEDFPQQYASDYSDATAYTDASAYAAAPATYQDTTYGTEAPAYAEPTAAYGDAGDYAASYEAPAAPAYDATAVDASAYAAAGYQEQPYQVADYQQQAYQGTSAYQDAQAFDEQIPAYQEASVYQDAPAYQPQAAQPAAYSANAGAAASFAAQRAYAIDPEVQANTPSASQVPDPFAAPAEAPATEAFSSASAEAYAEEVSYEPSEEAGFTTAFAPVTAGADTVQVNQGGVPVISFQDVSVVYPAQPNKPALEGVNVDVYAGEFVFLVGHSGSGKSTFLKLITRELKPTTGKIMVAGQDLTSMRNWKVPYLRRQIGCVFQDFKLLPDKTIFDNVAFALECIGKPRSVVKAQVPEVLRLVGLGEKMDVYPDQLSGGEQQRVSVARAMVNRPPLLVCDEPTGNLDPAISLGIMKLLERINRTGTTVLMATHDREMVDSMRKRVIALEGGHVVRDQERGGYGYYGAV